MRKFKFISLDPPWMFQVRSDKGMDRSAENHYPCLTIKDQRAMAPLIEAVMDKDSVMFMWCTPPFLKIGLDLMETYGYTFKTMGCWAKVSDTGKLQQGTGYHLRACMEPFIIGTKGKGGCPKPGTQKLSVMVAEWPNGSSIIEPEDYFAARTEHSRKPEESWEYGELYAGPHLEIYARREREGWTTLGNEVGECLDIRESLKNLADTIKSL